MPDFLSLNQLGMAVVFAAAFLLTHRYRAQPRAAPLPKQAYCGAGIVFAGQVLCYAGVVPVAVYFTPIAWTGYLLWVDGAIYSLRGRSLLRNRPWEFAWLAGCSIPLWLLFEAYNLRLANWIYVGLPDNVWLRILGYGWAFATIWPGIFETAMLLRALGWNAPPPAAADRAAHPPPATIGWIVSAAGLAMLMVPLLVGKEVGRYLFGLVWLGFIFLLEPLNRRTGRPSLWADLSRGDSSRLRALLWAGMLCGLWWEFWNWFAAARWFYTVPILPEWKVFAMPLPGYLGFPAFAVECFVLFALLAPWLGWLSQKLGYRSRPQWELFEL
ncbi:MAG TPA: hypothetical protein VNN17_00740 [Terriglobia bacterium]|nr:hypothetical protein [Terriglobia bacterium]